MPDPTPSAPIVAWLDDPGERGSPQGGTLIERGIPVTNAAPLPTRIDASQPPSPDRYPLGTPGFRYWAAADALRRASDFWGSILGANQAWHPNVGPTLEVVLDDGEDLNAFYDRASLRFFHATVGGRTVFSGESPDVICHELGHAVLDAIQPQLWDAASIEADAFHEAFGDMSTLLTSLQLPSMRQAVLAETEGRLYRSSRLSRLAEQLGWAIRQIHPQTVEAECLRDAVNGFFYRSPEKLPTSASASQLSAEPHSFSRVFTGAFFEALAKAFAAQPSQTEETLHEVSVEMGKLLVKAVRGASVVPDYFSQVAASLVREATQRGGGYGEAVRVAMARHGTLSISGVVDLARAPAPHGIAAIAGSSLPMHQLDVSRYGFTVPSVKLFAAAQPRHFSITGGSRSDGPAASSDEAARVFFEDLIRRGRLDPNGFVEPGVTIVDPETFKTHQLVGEGNDVVLRRRRIDCIPRRVGR
jgi:hypothetical protein